MLSLREIFKYNKGNIINDRPFSLYRYPEYLIEMALLRKHGFRSILEVGPGTDPFVAGIDPDYPCEKILAIDYCDEVIEHNKEHFNKPNVEFRTINLTDPEDAKNLSGEWDYVVCNATVEHVPDDQALIDCIYSHLKPGGILVFSTVLYHWLYNKWDYAMGHYRRYSVQDLKNLCTDFDEVQIIKTSLIQELVRPLFFNRIEHLLDSSLEENNRKVGFLEHAHPPYAKYYGLIKYLMPVYFVADWIFSKLLGGIVIVIAQKPKTAQKSPVLEPVAQLTEAG